MNYMEVKVMTNSQKKQTNSQKILKSLQENIGEISNEELSKAIGIDKSNIPRELRKLEKLGYTISRRYEQIGRGKCVWFQLTNNQEKQTNSQIQKPTKKVITSKIPESKLKAIPESSTLKSNSEIKNNNILTISQKREYLAPKFIKELGKELSLFGRTVPPDKKQEIINWVFINLPQLYEGLYNYLRIWKTRYHKYLIKSPESPVIPKYQKMQELLDYIKELQNLKKELETIKIKKGA